MLLRGKYLTYGIWWRTVNWIDNGLFAFVYCRNSAGDRGVKCLVDALGTNKTLEALDLKSNTIGLMGCRMLSSLLKERNATIRHLAISGNEVEQSTEEVSARGHWMGLLVNAACRSMCIHKPILHGASGFVL